MLASLGSVASSGKSFPQGTLLLMHFDGNLVNEVDAVALTPSNLVTYSTGIFGQALDAKQTNNTMLKYGNFSLTEMWTLEFLLKCKSMVFDNKAYLKLLLWDPNRNSNGCWGTLSLVIGLSSDANYIRMYVESDDGNSGKTVDTGQYSLGKISSNVKIKIVRALDGVLTLIVVRGDGAVLWNTNFASTGSGYWVANSNRQLSIDPLGYLYGGYMDTIVLDELLFRTGIADKTTMFPTAPY